MIGSTADCKIINLTSQNNIIDLNHKRVAPFDVKRIYYLYGIPENQVRGAHAHKELLQLMVAVSGFFTVELDDGKNKKKFFLNSPSKGLLIVPGIWRDLKNFSSEAICLVFASELYDETDYIRDYDEFLQYRSCLN